MNLEKLVIKPECCGIPNIRLILGFSAQIWLYINLLVNSYIIIKGTLVVLSIDHPFKEGHTWFTTVRFKLYLEDLGIDHSSLLNFLHFFCRKKSPSHFYRETTVKINYSLLIYSWIRHSFRGHSFESKMPCCGFWVRH